MHRSLLLLASLAAAVAQGGDAPAAAPDRGFVDGATSAVLRFEQRDGRAFVAARIGGQSVTLLVDPTGTNLLAPEVAARLGLAPDASAGAAGTPAVRAPTLELGGYALRDQPFYVVDLQRWRESEDGPVDGVLGLESFEQVVLTFDHAARLLTLADPAAFRAPERAVRLPLRFVERLPLVQASVDGHAGEFAIEPAARGPLTLHGRFVSDNGLLDQYAHGHESVVGWGLGGAERGYATRVGAFEWGGVRAPRVLAFLQAGERAQPGSRQVAGSIGGRLLARFTFSIDFVGRTLLLEPNAAIAAPDAYDRAGLWLNLDGEDLMIAALQPNGPAARAQLQQGDRIVAVDGVPATQLALGALRRRLAEAPAGTRVKVTARRDGKVIYANLLLTDLVPTP